MSKGKVYIVGAGAGGLDYLTVKAHRLISKEADIVIYDRLVSEEILSEINDSAERIFAGKEPKLHHMTQEQINEAIVDYSLKGKIVVRLKGGDPMLFARGGEEIEALRKNDIEYELVPGISAAFAFAAELEVPLTYRGVADGVIFISGHSYNDEAPKLDWEFLSKGDNTIVIYMGVGNIEIISKKLIEHGMAADTPVMVAQDVGSEKSKSLITELSKVAEEIRQNSITNPAIIAMGEVVNKSR